MTKSAPASAVEAGWQGRKIAVSGQLVTHFVPSHCWTAVTE